ncbi:MAG TPA: SUMF1/EgtB/PvdO family nonheme iron enzyme, partial [Myxococcota bacterium]
SEHELAAFVRALFPDKHRADEALIEEVALLALPPPDLESSTVLVAAEGDADAAREQEQNGELPFAFRDDDDPFDDVDTRPELTLEAWGRDGRPMVHVSGVGPAFFLDTAPVTRGEFARYLEETGAAPLDAAAGDDMDHAPMTSVSREQALAYAAWAGKRLPTSPEWDAALAREDEVAPAQRVLFAPIWQWTNTGFASAGFVVRGGAYRDQPREIPRPENVAFEDRAANDVGFRCAADVDAPGIVRALR